MTVYTLPINPFEENTYITVLGDGTCFVVDCGAYDQEDCRQVLEFLQSHHLTPVAHLLTHGHLDHCFGAAALHDAYGLIPYIHPDDRNLYENIALQCRVFGLPAPAQLLNECNTFSSAEQLPTLLQHCRIIPTPGHTPGGVCYYFEEQGEKILFSGDSLFMGSIGRTDLRGGNAQQLLDSLKQLTFLDDSTIVYPGHGPHTTMGQEKQYNPYL